MRLGYADPHHLAGQRGQKSKVEKKMQGTLRINRASMASIARQIVVCVLVCFAMTSSQAATIFKLDLGNIGPDIQLTPGDILGTVNDGNAGTVGDQDTSIQYVGGLSFLPDINGSFSLTGLAEAGPANVFGTLVNQNFLGGTFNLFNQANVLLLSGTLTNSALSGVLGPPGTGGAFSTTLGTVTGGTLAPQIAPNSISMSTNLTNVNGGNGFSVVGGGPVLAPFLSDSSISFAGDVVPEPATASLLFIAAAATTLRRRRAA